MGALFGPAGNAESFAKSGHKSTLEAPEFVKGFGLDIFEYQCGRGVRVSDEHAAAFRNNAENNGITVSLHAPYFISLSSVDEEKRIKSVDYILQSARAVKMLGGDRIVVHSGSCSKISREEALDFAKQTLELAVKALKDEGLEDIHICPETMGKINQLGTLDEVISLCKVSDSFIPCIDFGHLNARTLGGIKGKAEYESILYTIENELGFDRLKAFHSHFSKIEYTAGGEKRHLTFEDLQFGPVFEPLAELVAAKNLSPHFICESAGTQAEDALKMKTIYKELLK